MGLLPRLSALDRDQVRHFLDRGYLILKDCFPKEAGRAWMEKACAPLGYDLNDPGTWRDDKIFLTNTFEIDLREFAPKAWAAVADILGGERRVALRHGHGCALVINFHFGRDKPWEPPSAAFDGHWHLDGPPTPRYLDGEEMGLLVFAICSDVETRGGGTFLACDSVAPISRHLREHPEGVSKFDIPISGMLKGCRDFVELTAEAGDVVLVHPQMAHASSWNHSGRPRLMTSWLMELEQPLNFDRAAPEDYSVLERSILRALGVPRLAFRRAGSGRRVEARAERTAGDARPPADARPSIEIDPRVELIAVVEALSRGNPCPEGESSDYLSRALRSFDAKHPACALFARMTAPDWRQRHPSMIMLELSEPPDLRTAAGAERRRARGQDDALARFLPELRDFARREGFAEFFSSEKAFYDSFLEPAKGTFLALDYWTPARDYLGFCPAHRYHFVMAPLYHGPALHNAAVRRADGSHDFHSISGHLRTAGGRPALCDAEFGYRHILWRELARAAAADAAAAFRAELESLSSLRVRAAAPVRARYPGAEGWLQLASESFARAAVIRMIDRYTNFAKDGGSARAQAANEKARGYVLVGPIHELLLEYEKTRDRHPTIREFFPRVIEVLRSLDARLPR